VSVFPIVKDTKVYIQAIIDSASRYVLVGQITQDYDGADTKGPFETEHDVANGVSGNGEIPNFFVAVDGAENQKTMSTRW
jgi:hypothetical protein